MDQSSMLHSYERFVEHLAVKRALVQGQDWPGSPRETDFFIGACCFYLMLEKEPPKKWMEMLSLSAGMATKEQLNGENCSIVAPGRKRKRK